MYEEQRSPDSSPVRISPRSSPPCAASSHESASSDSSPTSPLKRKRQRDRMFSRNSLQAKIRILDEDLQLNNSLDEHGLLNQDREERCERTRLIHTNEEDSTSSSDSESSEAENSTSDLSDCDISLPSSEEDRTSNANNVSADSSPAPSSSDNGDSDSDSASAESVYSLFEGSDMTANEALVKIFKLYLEEHWTKTSLDKTLKLVKRLLPQPNELPSSGRSALRTLEKLTSSYSDTEYLYCDSCLQSVEGANCNECPESTSGKFYSFSIHDQLKHMFEQRNLASVMDYYRDHYVRRDGYISDVLDGSMYKDVRCQLMNQYDIVLMWNTDGLSKSKSSREEIWPILGTICEVPPRLRSSFMLVCGVYVGKSKPDMNVYLKPFKDALVNLWTQGVPWVHPRSKMVCNSKVVAPVLSADAPAKAIVVRNRNHNSRFGCNTCEQKTKKIMPPVENEEETGENVTNQRKRKRAVRRFVFQEQPARLREGLRMDRQGELAEIRGKSRKGVVGKAIVSKIPLLDRAKCIAAEYLHLICLGVVKYLLVRIFFTKGPWFIGDKIDEINNFIAAIKVPDFVTRLPRGLKDFKFWKGSEFRSFLLYYSLPLFKNLLPDKYFQHWLLLVGAMHILLQDSISEVELQRAEIMLRSFVRDVGDLYEPTSYTYNIHTLLHLGELTRRWGNLWSTAAFTYESFNGFIASNIHGTKHLGRELINNMKISQRVAVLQNIVSSIHEPQWVPKKVGSELLGKSLKFSDLNHVEQTVLNEANLGVGIVMHKRAKIGHILYTSKRYDDGKKRQNSLVQYKKDNGNFGFGQILLLLRDQDGAFHCILRLFKLLQQHTLYHLQSRVIIENLLPAKESENVIILPVEKINTKVLQVGMYIGLRPNSYEVNL